MGRTTRVSNSSIGLRQQQQQQQQKTKNKERKQDQQQQDNEHEKLVINGNNQDTKQRQREGSQEQDSLVARPKRRATNAHIFRYLQTRNPSKLEENDLKRALEASLEECPDFWPEDSASCSSSEQSNSVASCSSTNCSNVNNRRLSYTTTCCNFTNHKRKSFKKSSVQQNHLCNNCPQQQQNTAHNNNNISNSNQFTAINSNHCCPMSSVHNRYKPVAKKNIYNNDADFFHDGIMEYIEYELALAMSKQAEKRHKQKLAGMVNFVNNSLKHHSSTT